MTSPVYWWLDLPILGDVKLDNDSMMEGAPFSPEQVSPKDTVLQLKRRLEECHLENVGMQVLVGFG